MAENMCSYCCCKSYLLGLWVKICFFNRKMLKKKPYENRKNTRMSSKEKCNVTFTSCFFFLHYLADLKSKTFTYKKENSEKKKSPKHTNKLSVIYYLYVTQVMVLFEHVRVRPRN